MKKDMEEKNKNGKCKKRQRKKQHFEHFHWHNFIWVHICTEFIYDSCQSKSMKSVAKITHVSKLCMIIYS